MVCFLRQTGRDKSLPSVSFSSFTRFRRQNHLRTASLPSPLLCFKRFNVHWYYMTAFGSVYPLAILLTVLCGWMGWWLKEGEPNKSEWDFHQMRRVGISSMDSAIQKPKWKGPKEKRFSEASFLLPPHHSPWKHCHCFFKAALWTLSLFRRSAYQRVRVRVWVRNNWFHQDFSDDNWNPMSRWIIGRIMPCQVIKSLADDTWQGMIGRTSRRRWPILTSLCLLLFAVPSSPLH